MTVTFTYPIAYTISSPAGKCLLAIFYEYLEVYYSGINLDARSFVDHVNPKCPAVRGIRTLLQAFSVENPLLLRNEEGAR